jgi:hypothetical protein
MKKVVALLLAGAALVTSVAYARTFIETHIKCRSFQVYRDDSGAPHVVVSCESFDATGRTMRTFDSDVFNDLTGQQKTQLAAFVNIVTGHVYTRESIPSPTPTATP